MRRPLHPCLWKVVAVAVILGTATTSFAVTDEEIYRDFRFNFINPGGRSLGMGGTFIAIADDATAAQANPAGLTNILFPQFFSELRYQDVDESVTRIDETFPLSQDGFNIRVETEPEAVTSPSFLSYVHPWNELVFGFSRQEVLNTSNRTLNEEVFRFGTATDIRSGVGTIDLDLVNWNLSLGCVLLERFRIGATATFAQFELDSSLVNTYEDPTGDLIGDPSLAGVPFEMFSTEVHDDDTDVTFAAGLLVDVTQRISLGGVFRQGGDFVVDQTLTAQAIDPDLVPGQLTSLVFFNETDTLLTQDNDVASFENEFHVPDVLGGGVAWRATDRMTLTIDAVRIAWSDLTEGFNSRLNLLTAGWPTEEEARFTADDQTNLHFGFEYLLESSRLQWAIRTGYHQDRDNRIRADFPNGQFGLGLANNGIFPEGDDENHVSAGLGIATQGKFQLDLAVDASSESTTAVMSFQYEFPGRSNRPARGQSSGG
jgi:long-subunit fatty acid transport protein